jgi:type I restriction enzyme S subunit
MGMILKTVNPISLEKFMSTLLIIIINLTNELYKKLFPNHRPKSFYEPCMGTGGFIMGMYGNLSEEEQKNIPGSSFHGIEREPDSYASGMLNLLLTFKPESKDMEIPLIECKSSLVNNSTKTYDRINTNPPFAVSIEYKELIRKTPDLKTTVSDDEKEPCGVTMKSMYPVENSKSDGFVCFLQHCMFKLSENGVCSIVLPDGRFFTKDGKIQNMRKYLLEKCVLKAVLNVPSGVFEHTGISTAVLFFTKIQGHKTEIVEFYKTQVDCNNKCIGYEKLGDVSIDEIKKNDYVLSWSTYKPEILPEYKDVEWKTIGEICKFMSKSKRPASYGKKTGKYPFFKSSLKINSFIDEFDYNSESLIIGDGGMPNINYGIKFSCSDHCFILQNKNNDDVNIKFIYYYYLSILSQLEYLYNGTGIGNINKQQLSKIKIPIPSIEKQNAIVCQCDKITELKKNAETTIETLESLAKSYHDDNICKMYHDNTKWKTIGETCEKITVGDDIVKQNRVFGDIPFYGANGIIDYINKFKMDGKYLLTARTGSLGSLHITNGKFWYTGDVHAMRFNNVNLLKFVYYYLLNIDFQQYRTGSVYPKLNGKNLKSIKIPIPSIEKQNEMIEYYDFLHNAINEQKKLIKNYNLMIKNAISL